MIYLKWRNDILKLNKIMIMTLMLCLIISKSVYAQDNANASNEDQIKKAEQYLQEKGIEVPEEIEELCEYYGNKYKIAPELLEAIIWKESRFQSDAVSPSGACKGLMQINIKSHIERMEKLKVRNIFDPAANIAVGSNYLNDLLNDNSIEIAIMLYNGDSNAYKNGYISSYTKEVLDISEALEKIHNK